MREAHVKYHTHTQRTRVAKPRAGKLAQPIRPLPKGPSWQALEMWRRWKREHTQELERKFPGNYLAIWKKQVIATGRTWGEAYDNAITARPSAIPWVTYIPTPEEMSLVPILAG